MYLNALIVETYFRQFLICVHRFGSFTDVHIGNLLQHSFAFLDQLNITICTASYHMISYQYTC